MKDYHAIQAQGSPELREAVDCGEVAISDAAQVARQQLPGQQTKALEQVRTRKRPYFLEAVTYRFLGHSMADPAHGHYRTKAEVDEAKKRDPLLLLRTRMLGERLATEADFKRIEQEVAQIVREAVEFADASPAPPVTALEDDVYA